MDLNDKPANNDCKSDVYLAIAAHQQCNEWAGQIPASTLHRWAQRFNAEFKLDIPYVVIRLDTLPVSQLGSFRGHHNGFGLQYEVAVNPIYLNPKRPQWEPFATLLHQLLHAWQFSREIDHPTYIHDSEYRKKAAELGLAVNPNGITGCIPGGPFQYLLRTHGIIVAPEVILADGMPEGEIPKPVEINRSENSSKRLKGTSKLRKYSCGCTSIRVAKRAFRAVCLLCGQEFLQVESACGERDI